MQTMKMAQALTVTAPETLAIVAAGDGTADEAVLKSIYGVTQLPEISRLPRTGRFGIHLFNLRAALLARRRRAGLVLSRSIGAAAIAARLGLPTVFESHAPPSGAERGYWSALIGSNNFRRLVVISDALRELMATDFPVASHTDVVVAHDGVDISQFASMSNARSAKLIAGRNPDRPVAGYAGHLYGGRGIEIILSCAAKLPHWDFVIAGGTDTDANKLRGDVDRMNLANVKVLGFVPNAALPGRLAIADVLLMPYQPSVMTSGGTLDTARWMSPLKMFEYMAMNRAIVASDLAVLREVLDATKARLVAPGDNDGWIKALIGLEDTNRVLAGLLPAAACPIEESVTPVAS
jgi:glycosyltransferase involved in cell wall biosynthesis